VDSKSVNRSIRSQIWPLLRLAGFNSTTARSAWRHERDRIDVVNFQSFNSYHASVMGVTTFSFAVNLGTYLLYVPPQWPPKKIKDSVPYPAEHECHLRGRLKPSTTQSHKNEGVWGIDEKGSNLAWSIKDVENQIPTALAWFKRLEDRAEVLRILQEEDEDPFKLSGFGRRPSPIRSYLTGYVAMALGKDQLAEKEFEAAVASGCFSNLFSSAKGARYRAV
jgi:hypothetical protein